MNIWITSALIALFLCVVLLIYVLYSLQRIHKILLICLKEYRASQVANEKLLLRATGDILEALKDRDHHKETSSKF
jgi:hypothetical protein